jgi:hypothetical protein
MPNPPLFCFRSSSRFSALTLLVLLALAPLTRLQAQLPAAIEKMASATPLSLSLLDTVDKFVKTEKSDPAARAELDASGRDDEDMTAEKFAGVIKSKCPKLAAAFKSAGLAPELYFNAFGALAGTAVAIDLSMSGKNTGTNPTVQANVAFFKANKARCEATLHSL